MWPWGTKAKPAVQDESVHLLKKLCTQFEQLTEQVLQMQQSIKASVKPLVADSKIGPLESGARYMRAQRERLAAQAQSPTATAENIFKFTKPQPQPQQRTTKHAPLLRAISQLNERQSLVVLKNEEARKYHPTGIILNTKSKNAHRVLVWIVSQYYNEMAMRNNWPRKELQLASTPHCWYIICHTSIPAAEKK